MSNCVWRNSRKSLEKLENMIEIEFLPKFAAKIDIYKYKQTKSKVGKRWIKVKVHSFISQGFVMKKLMDSIFDDDSKNDISAATQIPVRMLFGGIGDSYSKENSLFAFDDPLNPLFGSKK